MNWFLGEAGGPAFLKAMMANPNVVATSLVAPDQVAANKEIFYKPNGTPRSAGEVYARINTPVGGPAVPTPISQEASNSASDKPAGLLRDEMKLSLLRGMFPRHVITPVEYDPWNYVPKGLDEKVNVSQGVS
jgi:hypothetical protein